MAKQEWDLYIDESGEFDDSNARNHDSLVGGLLVESSKLPDSLVDSLLPERVHCRDNPKQHHLDVLEQLTQIGGRLVIFFNTEKIHIIDSDTTYLNILTEGLLKLLRDMCSEMRDVKVNITIAKRTNMTEVRSVFIQEREYEVRLDEKIKLAGIRDGEKLCEYKIEYKNARNHRRLDFADIVCNTYLTRGGKNKFTDADRERIKALYDERFIYPVFESAAIRYAKQLLSEDRLGDAVGQLCLAAGSPQFSQPRQAALDRMALRTEAEREVAFSQVALLISKFVNDRNYLGGIEFANAYVQHFLLPMQEIGIGAQVGFRLFDTYFHILTMYDHVGNTEQCEAYRKRCRESIRFVNRSWEHIEYFFRYCIREMNVLMGRFDFEAVLENSERLIKRLLETKELFNLVSGEEEPAEENEATGSELLGKAYGVRLEAYINLLYDHPELADEALAVSDHALAEFTAEDDLSRQYQYRCMLMVQLREPEEALACLYCVYPKSKDAENPFRYILEQVYRDPSKPNNFALRHYTDVMLLLDMMKDSRADSMAKVLFDNPFFMQQLKSNDMQYHPWQLILWNISRWYGTHSSPTAAERYAKQAVELCFNVKENTTWQTFAISIVADRCLSQQDSVKARALCREWSKMYHRILDNAPPTLREHFAIGSEQPTRAELERLRQVYLK